MPLRPTERVSAVIVTYQPSLDGLERLIVAIAPQVDCLIVVDNGSGPGLRAWLLPRVPAARFESLGGNYGIARAQNIGIGMARAEGSEYVLLLDQDSVPAPDLVARLVEAARNKRAEGIKVAAVGPCCEDARQMNPIPFVRVEGLRLRRLTCSSSSPATIEVDYLIASGCLIPVEALDAVGVMREDFFIDCVDIEWGLRAQSKGYRSFGVCAARMRHALGDNTVYLARRHIPLHNPLRHYYHFRNAVWLYRQPWPPTNWKIVDSARLVRQFALFSLIISPRLAHARMMALGVAHGLTGRMGKKR